LLIKNTGREREREREREKEKKKRKKSSKHTFKKDYEQFEKL